MGGGNSLNFHSVVVHKIKVYESLGRAGFEECGGDAWLPARTNDDNRILNMNAGKKWEFISRLTLISVIRISLHHGKIHIHIKLRRVSRQGDE